jgi:hypothetical protein
VVVLGAWFLMREVELSTTPAALVKLLTKDVDGKPRVSWALPASKSDTKACGAVRTHGCSCISTSSPRKDCPAHAAWDQLLWLKRSFPAGWHGDAPPPELPMFPSSEGQVCSKEVVTATLVRAAELLGVPTATPDGSGRVSGHSLRATGAQGLCSLGLDVWAIQLLGRWGSSAVLGYVRDACLASSAEWATRASRSADLGKIVTQCTEGVPSTDRCTVALGRAREAAFSLVSNSSSPLALQASMTEQVVAACCPSLAQGRQLDIITNTRGVAHAVFSGPHFRSVFRCVVGN